MIYVDSIQHYPDYGLPYKFWCHMATNADLSELHAMARRIGLGRAWFQDKPRTPHYDLTPTKRAQALKLGAQATGSMELARRCFRRPRLDTRSFSSPEIGAIDMRKSHTTAWLPALLQRDTVRSLTITDLVVVAMTLYASV